MKRDRDQENGRARDRGEHFRVGRPDLLLGGRQRLPDAVPDARGRCLDGVAGTDGDTLRIGSERIRLHGIDALESAQSCSVSGKTWAYGEAARSRLSSTR